jgi:hypothetical protein
LFVKKLPESVKDNSLFFIQSNPLFFDQPKTRQPKKLEWFSAIAKTQSNQTFSNLIPFNAQQATLGKCFHVCLRCVCEICEVMRFP